MERSGLPGAWLKTREGTLGTAVWVGSGEKGCGQILLALGDGRLQWWETGDLVMVHPPHLTEDILVTARDIPAPGR